jgi:hypothetical protein
VVDPFLWLKSKELAELAVAAEQRKAAALERLAHCAEVYLASDAVSGAAAAAAARPPAGAVVIEAEDQAFADALYQIGQELARATGGAPSDEAILREYDLRYGTSDGVKVEAAHGE